MPAAVALRPLEPRDAPAVLALARSLPAWFNREGLAKMERDLETHQGIAATLGAVLVGFATWAPLAPGVADLSWMAVDTRHQRSGVGSALLDRLVEGLRREGFGSLVVSTVADSVDYPPYEGTRRFYRARGFKDLRVDPGYYGQGDDRYDRLVLRLALTA